MLNWAGMKSNFRLMASEIASWEWWKITSRNTTFDRRSLSSSLLMSQNKKTYRMSLTAVMYLTVRRLATNRLWDFALTAERNLSQMTIGLTIHNGIFLTSTDQVKFSNSLADFSPRVLVDLIKCVSDLHNLKKPLRTQFRCCINY